MRDVANGVGLSVLCGVGKPHQLGNGGNDGGGPPIFGGGEVDGIETGSIEAAIER